MVAVLGMRVRGPIIGLIAANMQIKHIMLERRTHSNKLYVDIAFVQVKLMVMAI